MNCRATALLSALVLSPTLLACSSAAPREEVVVAQQAETSENGLAWNGLMSNGLMSNGLMSNGLMSNGLMSNGLMSNGLTSGALTSLSGLGALLDTNAYTSMFLSYVVSCALPAGQSVVIASAADPDQSYTFNGSLGVAPAWGASDGASCDDTCQQWVSACVISRVNYLGVHVPLSLRGASSALALADGEATNYPDREATYFGNIFTSPQQLFGCRAASDDQALVDRPCGHGADVSGCIINVAGDCGSVCSVSDPSTGYFGGCSAGSTTYAPAVTVYRLP